MGEGKEEEEAEEKWEFRWNRSENKSWGQNFLEEEFKGGKKESL